MKNERPNDSKTKTTTLSDRFRNGMLFSHAFRLCIFHFKSASVESDDSSDDKNQCSKMILLFKLMCFGLYEFTDRKKSSKSDYV